MPNPDRHGVFDLIELIIRTYIYREMYRTLY